MNLLEMAFPLEQIWMSYGIISAGTYIIELKRAVVVGAAIIAENVVAVDGGDVAGATYYPNTWLVFM